MKKTSQHTACTYSFIPIIVLFYSLFSIFTSFCSFPGLIVFFDVVPAFLFVVGLFHFCILCSNCTGCNKYSYWSCVLSLSWFGNYLSVMLKCFWTLRWCFIKGRYVECFPTRSISKGKGDRLCQYSASYHQPLGFFLQTLILCLQSRRYSEKFVWCQSSFWHDLPRYFCTVF